MYAEEDQAKKGDGVDGGQVDASYTAAAQQEAEHGRTGTDPPCIAVNAQTNTSALHPTTGATTATTGPATTRPFAQAVGEAESESVEPRAEHDGKEPADGELPVLHHARVLVPLRLPFVDKRVRTPHPVVAEGVREARDAGHDHADVPVALLLLGCRAGQV